TALAIDATVVNDGTTWSTTVDFSSLSPEDGDYTFEFAETDLAGNESAINKEATFNVVFDGTAPEVESVAILSATDAPDGILNAGDVVTVQVTLDQATFVDINGGYPELTLTLDTVGNSQIAGATTVQAVYVSGSGTTDLIFEYVIQTGDTSIGGISIPDNALSPMSGTMKDAVGNAVADPMTGTAVVANPEYLVDAIVPIVNTVEITSATDAAVDNGVSTLNAGDVVTATVTLSEEVLVDLTNAGLTGLQLRLHIDDDTGDGKDVLADYVSGSASTALVFTYTIVADENTDSGISILADALLLDGVTVTDAAGNPAVLTDTSATLNGDYLVDTEAPETQILTVKSAPAFGSDELSSGDSTFDTTLVISGTKEAGASVEIYNGALLIETIAADNTEIWSYDTGDLDSGSYAFSAIETDFAGNDSVAGTTHNVIIEDPVEVIFDLTLGTVESDGVDFREFVSDVPYDILIIVNNDAAALDTVPFADITGVSLLGADDKITLVGRYDAVVNGPGISSNQVTAVTVDTSASQNTIKWYINSSASLAASLTNGGMFNRFGTDGTNNVALWGGLSSEVANFYSVSGSSTIQVDFLPHDMIA
ncbi:MAG: hypothetical protein ACJAWL_000606, partial [Motiliproteus sp.]